MTNDETLELVEKLLAEDESEVVEFKQAQYDMNKSSLKAYNDKLGKYFSALANEANLKGLNAAWLLLGVNDNKEIVGTEYNPDKIGDAIHHNTDPNMTFRHIHKAQHRNGKIILFEIPAAMKGSPVKWKSIYYGRAGSSLTELQTNKLKEILNHNESPDWSAQLLPSATLEHLDDNAIATAKERYAQKNAASSWAKNVASWPIDEFLTHLNLLKDGKLTRAAILLLGKEQSSHLLSPLMAQMLWVLEDTNIRTYEHFGIPFLLNTTALYQKIRNTQIKILPYNQLLPISVLKYDEGIVLEALHNCIAHQDYTLNSRINVSEFNDRLQLQSAGGFYEGKPEEYILGDKRPTKYRNSLLVDAMVKLHMIDSVGYGISQMYEKQAKRYLPLHDYECNDSMVRMTIHGNLLDESYSKWLIEKTDLPLADIVALDRVQKKLPIGNDEIARLRKAKLIEGRKPNFHVSAPVAAMTEQKAQYIRMRGQDNEHYEKLITDYLEKFNSASRKDINELLMEKLSDALTDKQKTLKIGNLLSNMRKRGIIVNTGSRTQSVWEIKKELRKN